MAKNTAIFSFLLMILVLFDVTMATQIYRVGDYVGWNNSTKVDYSKWSASKNFQVGDVLMFEFDPSNDNVFRVSAEDFAACRAPSPIGLPTNGQEFYPLDRPGRWYFVCSIPGRCESGQKLEILVHSTAASAPSPPPSSSPALTNPPAIMAPSPPPSSSPTPTNPPAIMAPSPPPSSSPAPSSSSSPAPTNPPTIMAPSPINPPAIMAPSPTNPPATMAPSPTNPPATMAPPQAPSPPSSSSPAASPPSESPSSGKLSPDDSPSNSPADQKSGSVAVSVNFWLAIVAVSFYVCSIACF